MSDLTEILGAIQALGERMEHRLSEQDRHNDQCFAEFKKYIDQRFADQDRRIEERFAEQDHRIEERFAEIKVYIDARFAEIKGYIDARFIEQDRRIDTQLHMLGERITHLEGRIEEQSRVMIALIPTRLAAVPAEASRK